MPLHFRIIKGRIHWVAQCVEHDMATQAESMDAMPEAISRCVIAEMVLAEMFGKTIRDIPAPPPEPAPEALEAIEIPPVEYWRQDGGVEIPVSLPPIYMLASSLS